MEDELLSEEARFYIQRENVKTPIFHRMLRSVQPSFSSMLETNNPAETFLPRTRSRSDPPRSRLVSESASPGRINWLNTRAQIDTAETYIWTNWTSWRW